MPTVSSFLWAATVTLLIGVFYFYTAFRVGILRGKHGIRAPAALYPIKPGWLAPLIGVIWIIARVIYLRSYMTDPEKRLVPAGICGLTNLAMLVVAVLGVGRAWLAQ